LIEIIPKKSSCSCAKILFVIITKSQPFTKEEIEKLKEVFDSYIKTVIDVEKKICSSGMDKHFEGEKILLNQGSNQSKIWGGGIDLYTQEIDFNSLINIRPNDNNSSNEIQNSDIRKLYEELTKFFFKEIYG
jgi:hypothetical protein